MVTDRLCACSWVKPNLRHPFKDFLENTSWLVKLKENRSAYANKKLEVLTET